MTVETQFFSEVYSRPGRAFKPMIQYVLQEIQKSRRDRFVKVSKVAVFFLQIMTDFRQFCLYYANPKLFFFNQGGPSVICSTALFFSARNSCFLYPVSLDLALPDPDSVFPGVVENITLVPCKQCTFYLQAILQYLLKVNFKCKNTLNRIRNRIKFASWIRK